MSTSTPSMLQRATASTAAAKASGQNPYGVITLDGIQYIERFQIFCDELTLTYSGQVVTNLRLTMPGVANFLLKGMARDITILNPMPDQAARGTGKPPGGRPGTLPDGRLPDGAPGTLPRLPRDLPGSQDRRFRFRMLGSEGATWFFSGGLGVYDDRAIDTMCFGNGQFPFPLIPPVPVNSSGSLMYEVQDLGLADAQDPDYFPYTIHFAFIGTYLIPVTTPNPQSFTYTVTGG